MPPLRRHLNIKAVNMESRMERSVNISALDHIQKLKNCQHWKIARSFTTSSKPVLCLMAGLLD
jgi:hypothetical protein